MDIKNLTEILLRQEMTFDQYFVLCLLEERQLAMIIKYLDSNGKFSKADIDSLIDKGYLFRTEIESYNADELFVTSMFSSLRKVVEGKNVKSTIIDLSWFNEWYDLFPSNVTSGNYRVKSKPSKCKENLKRFMKAHPKYTKDVIMKATKLYVDEFAQKNYEYMQLAYYFIYKGNINDSTLEDYCERVINGEDKPVNRGVGERTL
jgi:hypothetical protein